MQLASDARARGVGAVGDSFRGITAACCAGDDQYSRYAGAAVGAGVRRLRASVRSASVGGDSDRPLSPSDLEPGGMSGVKAKERNRYCRAPTVIRVIKHVHVHLGAVRVLLSAAFGSVLAAGDAIVVQPCPFSKVFCTLCLRPVSCCSGMCTLPRACRVGVAGSAAAGCDPGPHGALLAGAPRSGSGSGRR